MWKLSIDIGGKSQHLSIIYSYVYETERMNARGPHLLPLVPSLIVPKEWGFFCTYYTYITVLIRNAANLALLLLKGSKLRNGNKN
jgi:hypothetical protein